MNVWLDQLHALRQRAGPGRDGMPVTANETTPPKPTGDWDWPLYNEWQREEVYRTCLKLRELVDQADIRTWQHTNGRPRIPRRTVVLCLLVKAVFGFSYRRTEGVLHMVRLVLVIDHVPHYSTLAKYNQEPGLTRTLERVLRDSADPFWDIEDVLAVDASGLILEGPGAWRRDRHGDARKAYAKTHVLAGTRTRATLAWRFTRGTVHDSTQLPRLLENVPDDARAQAISGDKAYWTRDLCQVVKDHDLQPYLKPKDHARWRKFPDDAFEKMTRYALQFPNRFASVYHRRSAVESRYATVKQLFGDRLRCRQMVSRRNEALAKEIAHNARLLTWWEARSEAR